MTNPATYLPRCVAAAPRASIATAPAPLAEQYEPISAPQQRVPDAGKCAVS